MTKGIMFLKSLPHDATAAADFGLKEEMRAQETEREKERALEKEREKALQYTHRYVWTSWGHKTIIFDSFYCEFCNIGCCFYCIAFSVD